MASLLRAELADVVRQMERLQADARARVRWAVTMEEDAVA